MGEVYRGMDVKADRLVAIKTLLADADVGDDAYHLFSREAQTIANMKHMNIITMYHAGEQDCIP